MQVGHFGLTVQMFYLIMHILYRLLLAALHFNENASRAQAETLAGEKHIKISFPKYKQGGYAVREVKVDQTFSELK